MQLRTPLQGFEELGQIGRWTAGSAYGGLQVFGQCPHLLWRGTGVGGEPKFPSGAGQHPSPVAGGKRYRQPQVERSQVWGDLGVPAASQGLERLPSGVHHQPEEVTVSSQSRGVGASPVEREGDRDHKRRVAQQPAVYVGR